MNFSQTDTADDKAPSSLSVESNLNEWTGGRQQSNFGRKSNQ